MKLRKMFIGVIATLVLVGCNKAQELSVDLKEESIEVNSFATTCAIVKSVNGFEIDSIDEESHTMVANSELINCSKVDSSKLGETMVEYSKGDTKTYKIFTIVDRIAPTISAEESVIVEEGNNFFNLEALILVSDNFDENPSIEYEGNIDINKTGKYKVKVIAKDSSKNQAEAFVTVEVIEKEKEIVIVEVPPANNGGSVTPNPSKPGGTNDTKPSTQNPTPSKPNVQRPNDKFFMYADGFNMDTGYKACVEYITKASQNGYGGTCSSVDQNGISKGYKATIN